jgi:hypothetical protein
VYVCMCVCVCVWCERLNCVRAVSRDCVFSSIGFGERTVRYRGDCWCSSVRGNRGLFQKSVLEGGRLKKEGDLS